MKNNIDEFNSEALIQLSKIIDIDYIGTVIGAGFQTIVFRPEYYFKQKDLGLEIPCLIITKEQEKYKLTKKILGSKVKKLNKKEFYDDFLEIILFLEKIGWNLFYMEKLEKYYFDDNSKAFKVFYEFGKDTDNLICNKNNIYYYLENFKAYIDKYKPKEKGLYLALKKSFNAIKNSNINSEFQIDIHSEQFLMLENKLVCIDPVLFNYKELKR